MNFDFSDEQYMFQASVRELLSKELGFEQLRCGVPKTLWANLAEIGVFAILPAEEEGGLGLGFTDLALICEEFGRALVPPAVTASILGGAMISRLGTVDQRKILPRLVEGSARIALGVVDPLFGSGVTAEPSGEGWKLTGRKILVPDAVDADQMLVTATYDGQNCLFLVDLPQEGITLTKESALDITSMSHSVNFDSAVSLVLGDVPANAAFEFFNDAGAVISALQMTGIAVRMLDEVIDYVGQRVQFDRVIGSFQAVKHRCADLAVDIEACRSASYFAAWALDEGELSERRNATSMAKAWCGDKSAHVCNESIQLHGGTGFTPRRSNRYGVMRPGIANVL